MGKSWFEDRDEFDFKRESLTEEVHEKLTSISHQCRGDILKMTSVAGSGHPGGSLSSIDIYTVVYSLTDLKRDNVVVSHGHTSPGVYSILGRLGYIDTDDLITFFRYAGSYYEGHVERHIPEIAWSTGNLGQGLSAGCGFAMASKLKEEFSHAYVLMSDAEQAKGQVAEARRFASKFKLNNLTVVIDYNHFQISGRVEEIMPVNIKENYLSDEWMVLEVDGHNIRELYEALRTAKRDTDNRYAILAETTMGKGISFMEEDEGYHGKALNDGELEKALSELGIENDVEEYRKKRKESEPADKTEEINEETLPKLKTGEPREYKVEEKIGNRDAFGAALKDMGKLNKGSLIAAADCDLAGSVRIKEFGKNDNNFLIENGVSEHNTATITGVLSTRGIQAFFADFGVFGIDEVYNQQRLNAINRTKLRLVLTHCGINVGPDGKTHHCVDYLGLVSNIPDFYIIIPADANQTDRAVRWMPSHEGNVMLVCGRAKEPIIADDKGNPYFSGDYVFDYGKTDLIREGSDILIFAYGYTLHLSLKVREILKEKNISAGVINVSCPLALIYDEVKIIDDYDNVFTYEDHMIHTGLASIISKIIAEERVDTRLTAFGVDKFAPSGETGGVYKKMGLDPESVAKKIEDKVRGS